MEGYITTTEAAERLGLSSARVRQLVLSGALPATKFGPVNMVKETDLLLVKNRRGVGRPPKKTAKALHAEQVSKKGNTTRKLNEAFRKATEAEGSAKKKGKK